MKNFGKGVRLFIYFIWALAVVVSYLIIVYASPFAKENFPPNTLLLAFLFIAFLVIADKYPVVYFPKKRNAAEITVSMSLNFVVAFIFTPFVAIIVSALGSAIADLITKKEWYKNLFNVASIIITVGLTSLVFHRFYINFLPLISTHNLLVLTVAAVVYFFSETSILLGLLSIINREQFPIFWMRNVNSVWIEYFTLFPLGIIIIYLFQTSPWVNLFLIPTFVAIYFASKRKVQIEEETINALNAFAEAVDDKIHDTMQHSVRVARWVEELCNKLKIPEGKAYIITLAARLHDIGKVVVPDAILLKPSSLTEEQFETIKLHPLKGEEILNHFSFFKEGAKIIRNHHERYDGSGYPDGLKGEEIPLGSCIIAVVDAFDAMVSKRPYKKVTPWKEALKEIKRCKGTQFDPDIAEAFCDIAAKILKDPVKRKEYLPSLND